MKPALALRRSLVLTGTAALLMSCGSKKSESAAQGGGNKLKIAVTAQGLAALSTATSLSLANRALGLVAPEDETGGYPGIGINYGESVVDGLKVKLTRISLTGIPGKVSESPTLEVFNWSAAPKEIAVESGLNEKLEQTVELESKSGTYKAMSVSLRNSYKVKAYAYLDTDNNGSIDATIYTTASEIKRVDSRVAKADLASYDYFEYKFGLVGAAKSLDEREAEIGSITIFPNPVEINADGEVTTTAADGTTKTKSTAGLSVNLCIDTFRIVKVWDGRFGNSSDYVPGDASKIPYPVFPFPYAENDSRVLANGLKGVDFFPLGKPHFGLGDYIPMFAFPNLSAVMAEVYIVAKTSSITPFNSQIFTVATDGAGTPIIGKFSLGEGESTLHIGSAARLFAKSADGSYSFATNYGIKDANGVDDGGLYYNNDINMAGHLFTGFKSLANVGDTGTMTMKNGPRCKEQYDYCVAEAGVTAYYKRMR